MSGWVNIYEQNLMYKVNHPDFDPERVYRAIAYETYSESGWGWLLFMLEDGKTFNVTVKRCTCVNAQQFSRPIREGERSIKINPPKGDTYLEDIEG